MESLLRDGGRNIPGFLLNPAMRLRRCA